MLRKRKNRRYNEETNDEDGERKFDLAEQIKSERFEQIKDKHLQKLPGEAITLKLIQKHGFEKPILVTKPEGLELRVPPKSFLVRDVRNYVGHQRIIDVMDVKTQKNIEMSMKDWCKYYESKNRDRLLNVISLEFSHTKLDELVESPTIVKLLDWVDLVWPKFLKDSQTESTNSIDKMKYPKVQKYCLMSVKGSYTDFHIDFGGTSVWYHILRGRKIFWMVPPTELNLQIFEEWTLSGMQQDVFFGDTVEECFRVELRAGNTFFIPSGWIHAVYTLEDSLVFGGNFLHSFGMENQLKVSKIEDATKVPIKFRFPFYTEILWYAVQHYVYCLSNKDHLHRPEITATVISTPQTSNEKALLDEGNKNSIEIEDETTESEPEESDRNTNKKRKTAASGRKKGKPIKKSKKPPTDDESTDIDSSSEELAKLASNSKPATNTCRMTKNSLLRLQYEIDEQKSPNKTTTNSNKLENSGSSKPISKSATKKKPESTSTTTATKSSPPIDKRSNSSTSINLNSTDICLPQESPTKSNGWSSGSQSLWSNPSSDSKEPKKVHITKFELNGLKMLVKYLSKLSGAKKNLPTLIRNSRALLDDCRKLIAEHENDDPDLAITGKPITPELLNPKKTDMNELIGQFFKPSDAGGNDESGDTGLSSTATSSQTSNNNLSMKTKAELAQQRSLKFNHSAEVGALKFSPSDEKKANSSGNASSSSTNETGSCNNSASKSPHKETKCVSPIKKSSNSGSGAATASPPPRPKSPPTRPLSNNQYSSKTKQTNNNLLLPGSFEDLIAATSTEKKGMFDVSGSDVTSSLFSMKDYGSSCKSAGNSPKLTSLAPKPGTSSSSVGSIKSTLSASPKEPQTSTATNKPPKSPEPPKASVQKRFITSNFRPVNKEKLIFASAPYISPVHATDQARASKPYPWQTPAPMQNQAHPVTANQHAPSRHPPPTYSPSTPRQQHSTTMPQQQISGQANTPYMPNLRPIGQSHLTPNMPGQSRQTHHDQTKHEFVQLQSKVENPQAAAAGDTVNHHHQQQQHEAISNKESQQSANVIIKPNQQQQHQPVQQQTAQSLNDSHNKSGSAIGVAAIAQPVIVVKSEQLASATQTGNDDGQKNKKTVAKPRGPPKKSKEARQAVELATSSEKPLQTSVTGFAAVSVIQAGPSTATSTSSPVPSAPKSKNKRSKKQTEPVSTTQSTVTPINPEIVSQLHHIRPQAQQSVFCSLATPPTSTTSAIGTQISPQSYLITRPLLFNTMPAFSASQFQHMSRASPMPLLATSMASPLGLPLQQGARIVYATPPRRLAVPVTSGIGATAAPTMVTSVASNTSAKTTTVANSHSDNAALLSLATTALSTAPMVTSPALSQLNNRAPTQQAIMVSSTASQPTLFTTSAGQFFRPLLQRMPMTHFMATPGGPRPSGQLVFARLPNQGQPRYLITQPNFIQQRFQAPNIVTSQPTSTLAFAALKTPTDTPKAIKTKKVKTS